MADLVRETAIRRFLKDETDMRVGSDAIDRLGQLLTDLAGQIARKAKAQAVAEDRNTLLARDLDVAFESFLHTTGPSLLNATTLHAAINKLDDPTFIELTNLLRADIKEEL